MRGLCPIRTGASSRGTSWDSSKVRGDDPDMHWRDACRRCALDTCQTTVMDAFTGTFYCSTTVIRRWVVEAASGDKAAAPTGERKDASSPAQQSWRVVQTVGEADRQAGVTCMDVVHESVSGVVGMATVLVGRRNGVVELVRVDKVLGAVDAPSVVRRGGEGKEASGQAQGDGMSVSSVFGLVSPGGGRADGGSGGRGGRDARGGMVVGVVTRDGTVSFYDALLEKKLGGFSCPPQVTCAAYHAPSGQLAVGCEGAELKVYTISWQGEGDAKDTDSKDTAVSGTLTYSAKGGKPDKVGFCDKPWNSAVVFNPLVGDGSQIIVATGHGKLRIYDTKVGRRPQLSIPFKERRITSVSPDRGEQRWWVTDAGGNFQSYDVLMGKFLGGIRGVSGSIRSTDLHPVAPLIVSGGLDRYLRVHSTRTRAMVTRLYMTSQLSVVRWLGLAAGQGDDAPTAEKKKKKKTNSSLKASEASSSKKRRKT